MLATNGRVSGNSEPRSANGYAHPSHAASLAEFGEPLELPCCGGWLLKRRIRGTDQHDAMGCYPLFCCQDWTRLEEDLEALRGSLVSVALVTDPFAHWEPLQHRALFDVASPFKEHYVCELNQDPERFGTKHHRYYARKSLQDAQGEIVSNPLEWLDEWAELYAVLTARHGLKGIKAFSKCTFAAQMQVPGCVLIRLVSRGQILGAHLWYVQGPVAYSHLMALSEEGYRRGASYGLYATAIRHFKETAAAEVRWLNFGAGAGLGDSAGDGLSQFKRGWSTEVRTAWFCGKTLDHAAYERLVRSRQDLRPGNYFPLYRQGEF